MFFTVLAFLAVVLTVKTVFVGPESLVNISRMKHRNDSLKNKLVELEMKNAVLSYNLVRLKRDTAYWERVFRLSGMGKRGEAFFIVRNESLVLVYDFLESGETGISQ